MNQAQAQTYSRSGGAKPRKKQSRQDQLLAGDFNIVAYADLARPHQLALAHYMAVDGEAWESLLKLPAGRNSPRAIRKALAKALPEYVTRYGPVQFGVAMLKATDVIKSVAGDTEIAEDWPDWKAYHQWYCGQDSGPAVDHPRRNRWPVILSTFDDETLQDGWHRLHCYIRQGARKIPVVFYPQPHHLRAVGI
jgi:hypothetical protein